MGRPISKAGKNLVYMLWVQADLVQEYSDNDSNPNVSAWLRSGAVDAILEIEQELAELCY